MQPTRDPEHPCIFLPRCQECKALIALYLGHFSGFVGSNLEKCGNISLGTKSSLAQHSSGSYHVAPLGAREIDTNIVTHTFGCAVFDKSSVSDSVVPGLLPAPTKE